MNRRGFVGSVLSLVLTSCMGWKKPKRIGKMKDGVLHITVGPSPNADFIGNDDKAINAAADYLRSLPASVGKVKHEGTDWPKPRGVLHIEPGTYHLRDIVEFGGFWVDGNGAFMVNEIPRDKLDAYYGTSQIYEDV